ncbi:MAG: TonB-dependent receptor [Campylobacterota bacterium]|nr:TonB-dependent receptor [Campylobacterota bacterium]
MKKLLTFLMLSATLLHGEADINYDNLLLDSLDEVSTIATKTKLNIDDMPAFVTILRQDKLLELGIDNVYDALGLVPGIELSIESSGAKQIIFRGVKEKGKINLMVDGINVNNTYRGSIYHYLDFPVELIQRIEVIRGPASIMYGSGAIAGVVNIVTLNNSDGDNSVVFGRAGSYDDYKGGFHLTNSIDETHISLDGYYHKNLKYVDVGPDVGKNYGETNERLKDFSVGLHVNSNGWNFTTRYKRSDAGTHYGFGNYIPENSDDDQLINGTLYSQLSYENSINSDNTFKVDVGYNYYTQETDTRFAPSFGGIYYKSDYSEQSFYAKAQLSNQAFENHNILFGSEIIGSYALNTDLEIINHPVLNPENIIKPDVDRVVASFYVDDKIAITNDFDVTVGVRYDNYSDFGDAFSPRVGLVYSLSKNTNIKGMYSRAFRAPSWIELYSDIAGVSLGDENLQAEISDTFETGIIHDITPKNTLRVNGYISKISDTIYRDSTTKTYTQSGVDTFIGGEAEFDSSYFQDIDFNINFAYVKAEDSSGDDINGIANFLANAKLYYKFSHGITSGTLVKYVGSRKRDYGDFRDTLKPYLSFDETISFKYKSALISATVKNLFDEDIRYVSPQNTYVNDFQREGRTYWVSASWEF